jgi:DNA repair exonuclease SbcCD ATPase subunit
MRIKLKSIELRNFGTVRNSSVAFPDSGLVLVTGSNQTAEGRFESNGSGKSLLGDAIGRALFGIPGRFTKFKDYSRLDEGNTYVKLIAEIEGQSLVIEHGFRCQELSKTGEGLRYTLGNQTSVMFGHIDETRESLTKMIGMTPDVASWTVNINGDRLSFNDLSENSAVKLLMSVLNQPPWTEFQKKTENSLKKFKDQIYEVDGALEAAKQSRIQIESLVNQAQKKVDEEQSIHDKNLIACSRRQAERNAERELLKTENLEIEKRKTEIKKLISQAEKEEANQFHQIEQKILKQESKRKAAVSKSESFKLNLKTLNENLIQTNSSYSQAKSKYEKEAYAFANKARLEAISEKQKIVSENSKNSIEWNANLGRLEIVVHRISSEMKISEDKIAKAQENLTEEVNRPSICPLAGCGKPWPKNNEDKIQKLKQILQEAKNKDAELTAKFHEAVSKKEKHTGQPYVPIPLPEIPDEVEVPPFPSDKDEEWKKKISTIQAEIAQVEENIQKIKDEIEKIQEQTNEFQEEKNSLRKASVVSGLSKEYEEISDQLEKTNRRVSDLNRLDIEDIVNSKNLDLAKTQLSERKDRLKECLGQIDHSAKEKVQLLESISVIEYWAEAFGPTGIPNLIIAESVAPLNAISKKVGFFMTGGVLDVGYSTVRELQSGIEKNELVIKATNSFGSKNIRGSSKGESGLLDLIVAETFAEVGQTANRIGYRFYDEVAKSADPTVRRSIFKYISELAQRTGLLIFIVDHAVEVASYAQRVLVTRKTAEKGTEYHWQ